jgi:hypothetical protein
MRKRSERSDNVEQLGKFLVRCGRRNTRSSPCRLP